MQILIMVAKKQLTKFQGKLPIQIIVSFALYRGLIHLA